MQGRVQLIGTSLTVNTLYTCVCPPGRIGPTCEAHIGPCKCKNNGICVAADGGFMCTCPINFGFEKKNPLLFVELNILLLFRGYLCEYNLQEFYSCK